jgi:ABC-type branched-subunit amino acid transport system substrate-binding protein
VTAVAAQSKDFVILIPAALGDHWLAAPPPSLAGRLFIASPRASWTSAEAAAALSAIKVLVEGLKGAGRNLDRETLIKALERVSTSALRAAPACSFGPGRRVGVRGASILRLAPGGLAYEVVAPGVDPGPTTDD